MGLKTIVSRLCLFSLLCFTTLAAPVPESVSDIQIGHSHIIIEKRSGGSANDPIEANFNIAGWPNIAEENCYAMLCLLGANRVYQRNPTNNARGANYRASGASLVPFQAQNLADRHTSQINSNTVSAEEFPWASTQQGGAGAYVFPATTAEQSSQGNAIMNGYRASSVPLNNWFRISFTGAPFGTYCAALFSTPPDTSVCKTNPKETLFGTTGVTIADVAYQVVKTGLPYYFIHAAGSNKGNKRSDYVEVFVQETDKEIH